MKDSEHKTELCTNPFLSGEVAEELDFYRIRKTVAELCASEEGHNALLEREPCADGAVIEKLKQLGREWNIVLHTPYAQVIKGWPPVKQLFPLLGMEGAQLTQEQLFALGLFCNAQEQCRTQILKASTEISIPLLSDFARSLPDVSVARESIFSVLTNEGDVRDLPSIQAIRKRLVELHHAVDRAIKKYTSDSTFSQALQSTVPALRSGRELLAVRADRRGSINGIVHEVSASGQTLYIEPEEVVHANNELVQEECRLQNELRRIFRELTSKLGQSAEALVQGHAVMVQLDTGRAAASWQRQIQGVFAEHCDLQKEPPVFLQARHPLLGSQAVPVDILFMENKRVLIITGPNTGGKTVTLKTIALFALLNQAGFPVPAQEGTRLPIFEEVFADIGDEQSIDESLSTFSAHMKKIARMVCHSTSRSLLLLDELGSGTDPQEGGALAMAALDTFIERGAFVVVTTHHGILKNYGYTHSVCINASVEFNCATLSPTYRLLMGIPGESHALDIARGSGLGETVVNKARTYLTTQQADVSTLIAGLNKKHEELAQLIQRQEEQLYSLEKKSVRLHEMEVSLAERELVLKQNEHNQSSAFLAETRKRLENLVRELREGELTHEKTRGVKQFISELTKDIDQQEQNLLQAQTALSEARQAAENERAQFAQNGMRLVRQKEHQKSTKKKKSRRLSNAEALELAVAPQSFSERESQNTQKSMRTVSTKKCADLLFKPGVEVLFGLQRRRGVLLHKEKNNTWSIQCGSFTLSVPQAEIFPVHEKENRKLSSPAADAGIQLAMFEKTESPVFELRLLGMRFEEAMKALEKQLDLCVVNNFKNFSIIHGKGTGALQQGVHQYLSHFPGVAEFRFAPPEDGGTGKTYVSLR